METYMKVTPNDKTRSIRFETGLSVYDEALYRERYLARYWSANGQVLPESHLAEAAFFERAERFPLDSFLLTVNGQQLTRFSLLSQGEAPDNTTLFSNGPVKVWKTRLQSLDADIRVTVCTRLDGSEFLVRWLEIENCSDAPIGMNTKLSKEHPDWQMKRGDEYCVPYCEFYWGSYRLVDGGHALDLSKPEVIDWLEQMLSDHFENSGIDLYRIDHNHDMGLGGNRIRCGLRENVLWTYYENFYRLHHRLQKKYPNIVFQNCAGGGGRLDFGALNCFHNTEASDCNRQPKADKIYNNLSMLLPPERMRYLYSAESPDLPTECDLFSRVCTIFGGRPLLGGITPLSVQEANPLLLAKIKALTDYYKANLRDIQRDADVFHHTPMLPIFKPAKYSAVEYAEKSRQKAFICVHDLDATVTRHVCICPRSVTPGASYRITLVGRETSWVQDGLSLMHQGILLTDNLSEIILLEKLSV